MATIMTEVQRVLLTGAFKTVLGNDAKIENPRWASSDEAIVIMVAITEQERTDRNIAPDVVASWAVAVGPIGTAQAQLKVDPQIGEGEKEITGLHDLEIRAAEATQVLIAAGAPEAQV